jgi:hypothetical protein
MNVRMAPQGCGLCTTNRSRRTFVVISWNMSVLTAVKRNSTSELNHCVCAFGYRKCMTTALIKWCWPYRDIVVNAVTSAGNNYILDTNLQRQILKRDGGRAVDRSRWLRKVRSRYVLSHGPLKWHPRRASPRSSTKYYNGHHLEKEKEVPVVPSIHSGTRGSCDPSTGVPGWIGVHPLKPSRNPTESLGWGPTRC